MGVVVPSISRRSPRMFCAERLNVMKIRTRSTEELRRFSGAERKVCLAHTDRLKVLIYPTVCVVRCPSLRVLKQTYGANVPVRAEIEPVPGFTRDADQIARFDFNRDNWAVLWMDVK